MVTYDNQTPNISLEDNVNSSITEQSLTSTLPTKQSQDYALTEAQLETFISKKEGLSAKYLMPVMKPFLVAGMTEKQLEAIISIPFDNAATKGRNEKVYHFMEAVGRAYKSDFLESTTTNYNRFALFLDTLGQVEELKFGLASAGDPTGAYSLCIGLVHDLGLERAEYLFERLVEENKQGKTRVQKNMAALYQIKELVEESKKTGYEPEVLLDFRRAELDKAFYSDDESEA